MLPFAAVPGGPELLVVLFMLLVFVVAPVAVIALIFWLLRGRDVSGGGSATNEDADLERRVDALEERVERLESDVDPDDG